MKTTTRCVSSERIAEVRCVVETRQADNRLLCKPGEAAEMLNLAKSTVYHLVASGELPSVRVGKAIRISREAIDKWIRDQEERTRAA